MLRNKKGGLLVIDKSDGCSEEENRILEIHMMTEDSGRRARLIEVLVFDLMISGGSISRHGFNEFIMLFSSTGST